MSFLVDSEIRELLSSESPPIIGIKLLNDPDRIDSQIQPCSIDLRIKEIILPCSEEKATEDLAPRVRQCSLNVGESVKVTTIETIDLGNQYAGLFVAPARLTRKGIVLPDVGHIDPGFIGDLRITLINMGRHPHPLKHGDAVATILLYRLANPCNVGLRDRKGDQPYNKGIEDIKHLSDDFLEIHKKHREMETRLKELARKEAEAAVGQSGWRLAFFTWFLPILVTIVLTVAGTAFGYYTQVSKRVEQWESGLKEVNSRLRVMSRVVATFSVTRHLDERIDNLDRRLSELTDRVQEAKNSGFKRQAR